MRTRVKRVNFVDGKVLCANCEKPLPLTELRSEDVVYMLGDDKPRFVSMRCPACLTINEIEFEDD